MIESDTTIPKLTLTKMGVAHGFVRFAAATSVKMIVGTAIAQIVPTESKADKLKIIVGTYVLSGIVSDAAKTYASKELDEAVELLTLLKQKLKDGPNAPVTNNPTE